MVCGHVKTCVFKVVPFWEFSGERGIPPSPCPSESLDWRGFRKSDLQNLEPQGFRGQDHDNTGLAGFFVVVGCTASALTIFCFLAEERKVRCHTRSAGGPGFCIFFLVPERGCPVLAQTARRTGTHGGADPREIKRVGYASAPFVLLGGRVRPPLREQHRLRDGIPSQSGEAGTGKLGRSHGSGAAIASICWTKPGPCE